MEWGGSLTFKAADISGLAWDIVSLVRNDKTRLHRVLVHDEQQSKLCRRTSTSITSLIRSTDKIHRTEAHRSRARRASRKRLAYAHDPQNLCLSGKPTSDPQIQT